MSLRARIILFVLAMVAGVAGLVLVAGLLRAVEISDRVEELELRSVERAWNLSVLGASDVLHARLSHVATDPRVIEAARAGDQSALEGLMVEARRAGLLRLNVFGRDGELILASGDSFNPVALVGADRVNRAMREGEPIKGARVLDGGALGVVAGVVMTDADEKPIGVIVGAVSLEVALNRLSRSLDGSVHALDPAGALIHGPNDPVWRHAFELVGATREHLDITVDGRDHEVVVIPVPDMMGGRLATLVVSQDVTAEHERRALWANSLWVGLAGALLIAFAALYLHLRSAFATLDDAVEALHALARGGRGGYVELPAGTDEIGRIAQAVEVFGQAVREVERAASQRERRQRRQRRFIRRQMEQLAATLEDDARRELLEELARMEEEASDISSAQSKAVGDELGLIALGFSRLATKVGVQQVRLTQLVRDLREALEDKRKLISLQQELEIAANMQSSVLPREFPQSPLFDIAASMDPAKEVGGDFYDVFEIDETKLGVAIADVSGKGIPAAFFMLISRTMLRALAGDGYGPAETLERLNNLLAAENEQMMFVTVFYAEINRFTGEITYCNGGHNPPFIARADGRVEMVEKTPGIALATFPDLPFGEKTTRLEPGDTIFLYTDGVTEAFATDNINMFEERRVVETLSLSVPTSATEALERVMRAVAEFTTGAEQSDDITAVSVHWRG